ncbi:pirin family protein [Enterovibrio coralii]|uniref:Pilus assembly protein n=1 Tax=Enterovibrio coralii TaxID=294935 RepID=A0A135IBJ4_9GAMM|nr:pirin family protein [Enterovibrio coralii]KXF82830.1 pilus assembly protein [Enterovibrio coralii]
MQTLHRDSLPLGGFAGLREHRLVTDSRVFGSRKSPQTFEGLGNFIYLADARFNPNGETGMHPHHEVDVISVMIEGRVSHEGSLEHGKSLNAGDVQVQRAGGEGFSHNEVNPDATKNRMIQLWALPDTSGQPAGYKHYSPQKYGVTRIYGGDENQPETFDNQTHINIVKLAQSEKYRLSRDSLSYVTDGSALFSKDGEYVEATDGSLIRGEQLDIEAKTDVQIIVISQ